MKYQSLEIMDRIRKEATEENERMYESFMWMNVYQCASERWSEYHNSPYPEDQERAEREYTTMTLAMQKGTWWSIYEPPKNQFNL